MVFLTIGCAAAESMLRPGDRRMSDTIRAITRAIPDSFVDALVQTRPTEPIRIDGAREQHRAYVDALESLGVTVTVLPTLNEFPDCCFVEDCAVYAAGVASSTRLGAPSRRGEESSVASAL